MCTRTAHTGFWVVEGGWGCLIEMGSGVLIEFSGETNAAKHQQSRSANVYEARPATIGRKTEWPNHVYLVWLPVAWFLKLLSRVLVNACNFFDFWQLLSNLQAFPGATFRGGGGGGLFKNLFQAAGKVQWRIWISRMSLVIKLRVQVAHSTLCVTLVFARFWR